MRAFGRATRTHVDDRLITSVNESNNNGLPTPSDPRQRGTPLTPSVWLSHGRRLGKAGANPMAETQIRRNEIPNFCRAKSKSSQIRASSSKARAKSSKRKSLDFLRRIEPYQ
jgi:hypothetical protein